MTYIATFGLGHYLSPGRYVRIEASSLSKARDKMLEKYGQRWSALYESEEEAGVEKFGLECIDEF